MFDIYHDFEISAPRERVFEAIAAPSGLDAWWTKRSTGSPEPGAEYELFFGPEHDWRASVVSCVPGSEIEWEFTRSDEDWNGTRLGFHLEAADDRTQVRFHHTGWPEKNSHYRHSSYCWAMYLRLLGRFVEHGEIVPYEKRGST